MWTVRKPVDKSVGNFGDTNCPHFRGWTDSEGYGRYPQCFKKYSGHLDS